MPLFRGLHFKITNSTNPLSKIRMVMLITNYVLERENVILLALGSIQFVWPSFHFSICPASCKALDTERGKTVRRERLMKQAMWAEHSSVL